MEVSGDQCGRGGDRGQGGRGHRRGGDRGHGGRGQRQGDGEPGQAAPCKRDSGGKQAQLERQREAVKAAAHAERLDAMVVETEAAVESTKAAKRQAKAAQDAASTELPDATVGSKNYLLPFNKDLNSGAGACGRGTADSSAAGGSGSRAGGSSRRSRSGTGGR